MGLHCRLSGIFSAILLLITGILISCSSNKDITGTSVVGNPESVSAFIVDKNGVPQKNIPVALVPADYNAVKQDDSLLIVQGKTDSIGRVVLRLGNDSVYNLTSTNDLYRYEILEKVIISDSVKNLNEKTIELGKVQLKDPGIILVTIDSSSYSFGSYLAIPGTLIKMEIGAPGTYPLKSPAGVVDVEYCNLSYDTTDKKTFDSVQVNSRGTVKVTTLHSDVVISADTTTINDTIVILDTLEMKDTVINIETQHHTDTVITTESVLNVDSMITTDTIYIRSQILHGTKTINHIDSVVSADTTYSGDTATVIVSVKTVTNKDIIDTTKKFDTLWLLSSTKNIITTGTVKNMNCIDSVQTRSMVVKGTVLRTTRRIISILNIIVTSTPLSPKNFADTSIKKDTLVRTDVKEIVDSLIIPDTLVRMDTNVNTKIIPADSLLSMDTTLTIDTLKSSRASYSIDTMVYKDSTVHSDTVKSLIVNPDSIMVSVTYYEINSAGSKPEFEDPCVGVDCREESSDENQMALLNKNNRFSTPI